MKDGGYLMIDHRASPGLPEEVARRTGLNPKDVGEGKLYEAATLTCSHCKCTVVKNPLRTREREFCLKCYHYICDLCAAAMRQPDYVHATFEAVVQGDAPLGSPPRLLLPDEPT